MRTKGREMATIAASEYQIGALRRLIEARMVAANSPADAWPLGKLDVLGLRTWNRSSPDTVGRARRKSRLIPWLRSSDSAPSIAESCSISAGGAPVSVRAAPTRCQIRLQSPRSLAMVKTLSAMVLPRSRSSLVSAHSSNAATTGPSEARPGGEPSGSAVTRRRCRTPAEPRRRPTRDCPRRPGTTVDRRSSCTGRSVEDGSLPSCRPSRRPARLRPCGG